MTPLIERNTLNLWQEVIQRAAFKRTIILHPSLEMYLISLLIRYTNRPEFLKQVMGLAFLRALEKRAYARAQGLQKVGDECLLITGLFPLLPKKRLVTVSYFVNLGQSAYLAISDRNELFGTLSAQFVPLMDVLRGVRSYSQAFPQEAIELIDYPH